MRSVVWTPGGAGLPLGRAPAVAAFCRCLFLALFGWVVASQARLGCRYWAEHQPVTPAWPCAVLCLSCPPTMHGLVAIRGGRGAYRQPCFQLMSTVFFFPFNCFVAAFLVSVLSVCSGTCLRRSFIQSRRGLGWEHEEINLSCEMWNCSCSKRHFFLL